MALYDRGHFQKEDCCGMDGAVPISGKTLRKSCQSVFTSSGACAISGILKQKGVVVCRHCGTFCNRAAKTHGFAPYYHIPIKRTIGWLAVTTACTGTLGFSLRVADGLAVGMGGMYRTTIGITRFTPRACNFPRLSRCSSHLCQKHG